MTSTKPVVAAVSQATRERGSCARNASRIASEIWSHSLSGWPSVTDSEVKKSCGDCIKDVGMGRLLVWLIFNSLRQHGTLSFVWNIFARLGENIPDKG